MPKSNNRFNLSKSDNYNLNIIDDDDDAFEDSFEDQQELDYSTTANDNLYKLNNNSSLINGNR